MGAYKQKAEFFENYDDEAPSFYNAKTLDECFAELIKTRGWYKGVADADRKKAYYDKTLFLKGDLPDERKRQYLEGAGYSVCQKELWIKKTK